MSLSNPPQTASVSPATPVPTGMATGSSSGSEQAGGRQFVDRRQGGGSKSRGERRQFGSSHEGLSEAGRELAQAIDQYKLNHHRRYITCDEMLAVIKSLGYSK